MAVILGYADKRTLRAGDSIGFMVSAEGLGRFRAQIVRLRAPDAGPPPHMPQYCADPVHHPMNGEYRARVQPLRPGSYVAVDAWTVDPSAPFTLTMRLEPTLLTPNGHALVSTLSSAGTTGIEIGLDGAGQLYMQVGTGAGPVTWHSGLYCTARRWSALTLAYAPDTGAVAATLSELPSHRLEPTQLAEASFNLPPSGAEVTRGLRIAAGLDRNGNPARIYNGKIERPRWLAGWADAAQRRSICAVPPDRPAPRPALGDWDFSQQIDSETVVDASGNGQHGCTMQMPARGVIGSLWDTSALDWRHTPSHYGAIHFHDDDMIDAGWSEDFVVTTGADWASGCYAVHLTGGDAEFFVPFFVRPARDADRATAAFLVPTCTYSAYANLRVRVSGQWNELIHGRLTVLDSTDLLLLSHPGLGLSCYDGHSDGSTVLYSSLSRPVTNFRPNGRLYKFCQDLLILAWAEAAGFDVDILTDEDLHAEGAAALTGYRTILTGSHPEYWTTSMLDGLEDWLGTGGRMMYLGGNGFFWRTAYHPHRPGSVEVRRVGMEQLWTTGAGETVFSTTGEPGGTWAHAGRQPNLIAGVGFITQGFDANSYYRKREDAWNLRADFIFDGVEEDRIGDFGALMGGAAGYEIDRHDAALGSPAHALVLASSENHSNLYDLMVGSIVDVLPSAVADAPDALRADMVFFETPAGGAVFSVGSIAWCGSLSWNSYDNNVARVTANVLTRFNDPAPFAMP